MIRKNLISIILAAGTGSRLKSKTPKVLLKINNKTLINYSIELAGKFSNKINIVINKSLIFLKKKFQKNNFFIQKKSLGTGHAVLTCLNKIQLDKKFNYLVLYADTPFISKTDISNMLKKIVFMDLVILAFTSNNNKGCGLLKKKKNKVNQIIEYKNANKKEREITLCNSGIMLFNYKVRKLVKVIKKNNLTKEFYLTDLVELANENKLKVGYVTSKNELRSRGINDLKTYRTNQNYFEKKY